MMREILWQRKGRTHLCRIYLLIGTKRKGGMKLEVIYPQEASPTWDVLKLTTTRQCWMGCHFCDFSNFTPMKPAHPIAPSLPIPVAEKALKTLEVKVDLVKVRGGLTFREPFEYFRTLVHRVSQHHSTIQVYSPVELHQWHRMEQRPIRDLLAELRWAGATGIGPGGGESLVQAWRDRLSPNRLSANAWIDIAQLGWDIGLPPTAMVLAGDWLSTDDYREHLSRLADFRWGTIEMKLFRASDAHPELESSHLLKILTLIEMTRSYLGEIPLVISDPRGELSDDAKILMTQAGCDAFYRTVAEVAP